MIYLYVYMEYIVILFVVLQISGWTWDYVRVFTCYPFQTDPCCIAGRYYIHYAMVACTYILLLYCREIESWAGAKMANPVLDPANFSIENFILDCRHKGRDWKGFKIIMLFTLIIVMMRHKGAEHFLWDRFYRSLFMSAIECTYHGDWAHGDFEYAR